MTAKRRWVPAFAGTTGFRRMKINDAIFGAILAVLGAVVLVHVQAFPKIPGQQYGPGAVSRRRSPPASSFAACCSSSAASATAPAIRGSSPASGCARRDTCVAAGAVVAGHGCLHPRLPTRVGFLITAPILLLFWFLRLRRRAGRPRSSRSTVTTLVIWYAFYKLLRVPLPWGVLTKLRVLAMDALAQAFGLVFNLETMLVDRSGRRCSACSSVPCPG